MSVEALLRSRKSRNVTPREAWTAYNAVANPPTTPTEPGAFIAQQKSAAFRAGEILDKGEKITNNIATVCAVVGVGAALYLLYRMVSERMERDEKLTAKLEKQIAEDPAVKEALDASTPAT